MSGKKILVLVWWKAFGCKSCHFLSRIRSWLQTQNSSSLTLRDVIISLQGTLNGSLSLQDPISHISIFLQCPHSHGYLCLWCIHFHGPIFLQETWFFGPLPFLGLHYHEHISLEEPHFHGPLSPQGTFSHAPGIHQIYHTDELHCVPFNLGWKKELGKPWLLKIAN